MDKNVSTTIKIDKVIFIIITLALIIGIGVIFFDGSESKNNIAINDISQNNEIKDGVQYITVNAKGGYSPRVSTAKAGIPTKLIIKTSGTYDCSAALVIRSLGFQKILAQTGKEVIDVGTPKVGQSLQGVCGMGMYSFQVRFN